MVGKTKSSNNDCAGRKNRKDAEKCTCLPHALQAAVLSRKEKIIQFHIFNDIYDWDPTARAKLC